jgi:deoxyxylulose-5-phosphate synthase
MRFERSYPEILDGIYGEDEYDSQFFDEGMRYLRSADMNSDVCIISNGYMLGRAISLFEKLNEVGITSKVLDVYKTEEINKEFFKSYVKGFKTFITLEEQTLSGGFGSSICEVLVDANIPFNRVLRFGLPPRYIFENGNREQLLNSNGLSKERIFENAIGYLKK